jgi:hypothetical protein
VLAVAPPVDVLAPPPVGTDGPVAMFNVNLILLSYISLYYKNIQRYILQIKYKQET